MAETSQSVMRIVALIAFTSLFAGAWANDRPVERMAQKTPPKSTTILSHEKGHLKPDSERIHLESVKPPVVNSKQVIRPVLQEQNLDKASITMTLTVETEGLTLKDNLVRDHIRKLPLGIANGDYLMVDAKGGVGWVHIRGQAEKKEAEAIFTTQVGEEVVRYLRVTPVDAIPAENKIVPTPLQYAGEELKTIR